jgi:ABC-type phosphate transport system substrate-binding protein
VSAASAAWRARFPILLLAAMQCAAVQAAAAEVVVVVSENSPITRLSDNEIADAFLGKLTRLPGGTSVVPLDQSEGRAAREAFYMKFTGKSPAQLKAFWSKIIFTGRGRPPRMLANDAEVIRALQANPGAIGYVERSSVGPGARILR